MLWDRCLEADDCNVHILEAANQRAKSVACSYYLGAIARLAYGCLQRETQWQLNHYQHNEVTTASNESMKLSLHAFDEQMRAKKLMCITCWNSLPLAP